MRCTSAWIEHPPVRDDLRSVVYSLTYSPDGSQLVVGAGSRVIVYDTGGDPVHTLKGHTDAVYAVAYSQDGTRFASGGADSTVIVWGCDGQGRLKYTHASSIQALAYNPVTQQLASCSESDLGLWSPEVRSVPKVPLLSRPLCVAWAPDGQVLAVGCEDGSVSLRDKAGTERATVARSAPVWALAFAPEGDAAEAALLAIGSWDGLLSFYQTDGSPAASKSVELGCNPCCLAFTRDNQSLVVGGTDSKLHMYTRAGVFLSTLATKASWVWSCATRPGKSRAEVHVAAGCEDGSVCCDVVSIATVDGLYKDLYAHRENMTDLVIRSLSGPQRVRIRCRDCIQNLAVFDSLAAVKVTAGVVVYEGTRADGGGLQYRVRNRVPLASACEHMLLASRHIILFDQRKVRCYDFEGSRTREWVLDATVRFVKALGGPSGGEGILVACRNGQFVTIFLNNPFAVPIWKHGAGILGADISSRCTELAIIDDASALSVVNLQSGQIRFEDQKVTSVAFNTQHNDMVAYTSMNTLCVCAANFKPYRQRMSSLVVAFAGAKVFCLHNVSTKAEDVPLSSIVRQYIEAAQWQQAYKVACLGVTKEDWDALAHAALRDLNTDIARKAFIRTQDLVMINLVHRLEAAARAGQQRELLKGDVLTYQGKFDEAAEVFAGAGALQRAIDMWSDLREFDKAKEWANKGGHAGKADALRAQQALWSEELRDYKSAADMYLESGEADRAVRLLIQHSQDWGYLRQIARKLDRQQHGSTLLLVASALHEHGELDGAKEALMKAEAWETLIELHVEAEAWSSAFMVAKRCPASEPGLHEAHAIWLLRKSRHEEAQAAFHRAGKPEMAQQLLRELLLGSIACCSFQHASYCLHQMAMQVLQDVEPAVDGRRRPADEARLTRFSLLYQQAGLYYAYDIIHRTLASPFPVVEARLVFSTACFLFSSLLHDAVPPGMSLCSVAIVLAQEAERQGAWKVARLAYAKLLSLHVAPRWRNMVTSGSVLIRSRPLIDDLRTAQRCARCQAALPRVTLSRDACPSCGATPNRCFATFEPLPLVEFQLADGISDDEAAALLAAEPDRPRSVRTRPPDEATLGGIERRDEGGAECLRLDSDDGEAEGAYDAMFTPAVGESADGLNAFVAQFAIPNAAVVADRATLRNMTVADVLVRRWPNPHIPHQYFWTTDPEADLCIGDCGHFFQELEYDSLCFQLGHCPMSQWRATARAQQVQVISV